MTEEKKPTYVEEKKFAILTKDSIRLFAEAAGYSDLSDDAAAILGEDVSYRLREAAQNSTQFMKHCKRRKLTTEDFNKALKNADVQPIHGYGSVDSLPFKQSKEGEIHFTEDLDVNFGNIAFSSYNPKSLGETTIKAHWLAVEGCHKGVSSSQQSDQGKSQEKQKDLNENLIMYYNNVTKAILSSEEEVMKTALADLRTNPNFVPLLPSFITFIANGVKTLNHDIEQLTKLLHTVRALINNQSLYLEPQAYLNHLVQSVMYCVLEPLAASINPANDHWILRDYASRLLAQIINKWTSSINQLRLSTLRSLKDVLLDLTKPLCSHYGAVMGLLALGCSALMSLCHSRIQVEPGNVLDRLLISRLMIEENLIVHLPVIIPHLNSIMEDTSYANGQSKGDAQKVHSAILDLLEHIYVCYLVKQVPLTQALSDQLASEFVLNGRIENFKDQFLPDTDLLENGAIDNSLLLDLKSKPPDLFSATSVKSHFELYKELFEYFGDSLSMKLPIMDLKMVFQPKMKEKTVKFLEGGDNRSGENMLQEMMEQVKAQQILEAKLRVEREKQEAIRRERERKEEEQRRKEEAERQQLELEQRKKDELERRLLKEQRKREQLKMRQRQFGRLQPEQVMENYRYEAGMGSPNYPDIGNPDFADEELKSDHSDSVSDERSEEEEEHQPVNCEMTVKSTVTDPTRGIKMLIYKQPKSAQPRLPKLLVKEDRVAVTEPTEWVEKPKDKHKESKLKKRKPSQKSPKSLDAAEYGESSSMDEYKPKYISQIYSPGEGESSSDGGGVKITLKLRVKDPKE